MPFHWGNPELKPEKSEQCEVGLKIILPLPGQLSIGVDYNHSYVKDLIFWHRRIPQSGHSVCHCHCLERDNARKAR